MLGTSLVVQWLRLSTSTAGALDWTPGWGNKILPGTLCAPLNPAKKIINSPTRMAKVQNIKNTKDQQRHGAMGTFIYYQCTRTLILEHKWIQLLWKLVHALNLIILLLYIIALLLLGIYLTEMTAHIHKICLKVYSSNLKDSTTLEIIQMPISARMDKRNMAYQNTENSTLI